MYLLETIRELFTLNGMINAINIIPQILASFSIGSLKIAANEIFIFAPVFNSPPERRSTRHDECQTVKLHHSKGSKNFSLASLMSKTLFHVSFPRSARRSREHAERSAVAPSRSRLPESVKAQREFSESFSFRWVRKRSSSSHEFQFSCKSRARRFDVKVAVTTHLK